MPLMKIAMNNLFVYDSPVGKIVIKDYSGSITEVYFIKDDEVIHEGNLKETPLIKEAAKQLTEYFEGKRKDFDLPIETKGTAFQKSVWEALRTIPYGETWSYKQVAEAVNSPKAYRAVGMANNKNPISIIIPCHRVIGANGKMVGYGGGLHIKEYLLNLEKGTYKEGDLHVKNKKFYREELW